MLTCVHKVLPEESEQCMLCQFNCISKDYNGIIGFALDHSKLKMKQELGM
jgi:hypothetical protein